MRRRRDRNGRVSVEWTGDIFLPSKFTRGVEAVAHIIWRAGALFESFRLGAWSREAVGRMYGRWSRGHEE